MVTKSLSDFCRFFKEAFSNKINNKFGFLVKKYLEIVFEVWNLTHFWPKYRQKTVFLRFWPKIGLFIKYRILLTRIKIFLQFFSLYSKMSRIFRILSPFFDQTFPSCWKMVPKIPKMTIFPSLYVLKLVVLTFNNYNINLLKCY